MCQRGALRVCDVPEGGAEGDVPVRCAEGI